MAIHKKEAFLPEEQSLAAAAKALAHPARLAILKELAKREGCICGELVQALPLAQSTVSQHLRELKDSGLISGTVDGPKSCYCINYPAFKKAMEQFNELFITLQIQQRHTVHCKEKGTE